VRSLTVIAGVSTDALLMLAGLSRTGSTERTSDSGWTLMPLVAAPSIEIPAVPSPLPTRSWANVPPKECPMMTGALSSLLM
jgi:hypothetical protein